ncbi:MAG: GGDEF domain-containing protein, partial [Oscillospiraceae bacterium]|nr:GGDEF domain-containing protein [Oscillospiraceae bacterium]
ADRSKSLVLERVGIKEIDKLSEVIESYSEDIIINSAKKSKIVDLISNPIATFEISKNEDKVFVSNSIVNILQLNPAIIINGYINKKEWDEIYADLTSSENISYEGSYHVNKEAGNENSGQWLKINTYESDKYIIGVITDISEQILERKRIEYERSHDALTGIINRRTFLLRTEEILNNCKNAVVALWDIKNIKFINNKYGHENGDKLIKAATRVLDSVSNDRHTITARLSGDEFVTIFFGEKDVSAYKNEVRNLYELLSNVVVETPDGEEIRIEAAVGTACYPFDAPDIKGLLRCTDSTLLNNKNENGRHSDGIFEYKAY